jgi:tRNA1(Val) A37 N6-methylase TrmN6
MPCSCCAFDQTAERQFTQQKAATEIARYRNKGAGPTTRLLRDGLGKAGRVSGTLLDIGGGVGALSFELLEHGLARAVIVDASPAYLSAASQEAERRGRSRVVQAVAGDFVVLSDQLPSADVVALDRVVCCYPSYGPLVQDAVRHAESAFAYSYPRDRWYVRLGVWLENAVRRWRNNPFRTFVHSPQEMQRIVEAAGFELADRQTTLTWSADIFVRRA